MLRGESPYRTFAENLYLLILRDQEGRYRRYPVFRHRTQIDRIGRIARHGIHFGNEQQTLDDFLHHIDLAEHPRQSSRGDLLFHQQPKYGERRAQFVRGIRREVPLYAIGVFHPVKRRIESAQKRQHLGRHAIDIHALLQLIGETRSTSREARLTGSSDCRTI